MADDPPSPPRQGKRPPRGPRRPPRQVTQRSLENVALHHLQRFATSTAALRRVLLKRVDRALKHHPGDRAEQVGWVEALLARLQAAQLLDDATFARARVTSLQTRGASARGIRSKLAQKGVAKDVVDVALEAAAPDLEAARAYARRRRLGPHRRDDEDRAAHRQKDLAALARQGFSFAVAKQALTPDDE